MALSLATLAALLLDMLLGEPRRWHPLAGFGRVAQRLEARLNDNSRARGVCAAVALLLPPLLVAWGVVASLPPLLGWVVATAVATFCIGHRSLREHAFAVWRPLVEEDIDNARQQVARLVSRDTDHMDAPAIRRATIESVLENGSDGVLASLFWFVAGGLLAGPDGAVALTLCHRLVNTLDAMWGYRSPRYENFGWAVARLDDVFNWLPARVTALMYASAGRGAIALSCWRRQARACASPNAGPVMTAGGGALGVRLGGGGFYHGVWRDKPRFGSGRTATDDDIGQALGLVRRALVVGLATVVVFDAVCS